MTIFNIVLWFILTAAVYGGLFAVWIFMSVQVFQAGVSRLEAKLIVIMK